MKPLLAHVFEPHRWDGSSCFVQPKLNGVRALYQDGHFQAREELPWNPKVLAHLTDVLLDMFPDPSTILDGELYVHGWPLQRINGAVQIARTEPREDTHEVEYWVFDSVNYQAPFVRRFALVESRIKQLAHPLINVVTTVETKDPTFVEEFYARTVAEGFEGIMYRLGDCPYTIPKQNVYYKDGKWMSGPTKFLSDKNNRCWHLLKRKDWKDEEFECVAIEEGGGKRRGMVGALVCNITTDLGKSPGSHDYLHRTFNVGSGLTDAENIHYFNNPDQVIGHKIKVKFLCYTRDGIPFNPTIEAIL